MGRLIGFIMFLIYFTGIVLAKGFWLTLVAFVFPPYAWYLTVHMILLKYNFI
ncbi:hypothetical protein Acj133p051 [Acinetobacter phage 133]|uniref:Uncharacterized protein n=1 Tax=Acinetobacter phage 133 TaxID=2919552 RepID=D9I617_9CAUD|nr:hypothetical protein Acj133p051 [Acinetobacter phage 133]ADJ19398.1 hypothetical protein Acj133p051 [Acinetobacter phage 133]